MNEEAYCDGSGMDLWIGSGLTSGTLDEKCECMGCDKKLSSIQRIAALAITGAMKTTATDLLEVHANLLPPTLLLQNHCHRAVICLTTHPKTHPLYEPL
jgi:hypothetical protein